MPSPSPNSCPPQRTRTLFLAAALLTSVVVAAPADAFRLRGVALSDSGGYVTLVFRVHLVGDSLYGKVRCIGQCLAAGYRLNLTVASDSSFTGAAISFDGTTQCDFAGVLTNPPALEGRYDCLRDDGIEDTGSFQVTR